MKGCVLSQSLKVSVFGTWHGLYQTFKWYSTTYIFCAGQYFLFELAKKLAQITKTSKGSLLILILNFSFCFYLKKAENNSKNTKWSLLILILNFFLFVLGTAITTTWNEFTRYTGKFNEGKSALLPLPKIHVPTTAHDIRQVHQFASAA